MELRAALGQAASWTHLAPVRRVMASKDRSVTIGKNIHQQEFVTYVTLLNGASLNSMKKLVFCLKLLSKCQYLAKIMRKMLDYEIL